MNNKLTIWLLLLVLAGGAGAAVNKLDAKTAEKYLDNASLQYITGDLETALDNINLSLKFYPGNAAAQRLKQSIQRELALAQPTAAAIPAVEAKEKEAKFYLNTENYFLLAISSAVVGCVALLLIVNFFRQLISRGGTEEYRCPSCGEKLSSSTEMCRNCGNNTSRKIWDSISSEQRHWYRRKNWKGNPFSLNISQGLFTGYSKEVKTILEKINTRSGHILITGPLGVGKTSMLRWLTTQLPKKEFMPIYISRPPLDFNELVRHIYESMGDNTDQARKEANLYNLNKLRQKIKKNIIILLDEAHEFTVEVERPLRTLGDIEGVNLVMAGLPETISKLKTEIQPLYERLVLSVELSHMGFDESREMIKIRIESVGGKGTHPFTAAAINKVYEIAKGNPRVTIKICDAAVAQAIAQGEEIIGPDFIKAIERAEQKS